MPTTSRFPWPQRTTMVAGVLLLITAALLLLERTQAALPVTTSFVIPLSGQVVQLAGAITRAAGFVVAAVGIGGEIGIAGASRLGRSALVVWGIQDLVFALKVLLPFGSDGTASASAWTGTALTVVFVAAALIAAVAVARSGVLSGFARWVLLPVAIIDLAFACLSLIPVPLSVLTALSSVPTGFIDPVLAALIGVALLLWSRTEAVKHRAKAVYDAW